MKMTNINHIIDYGNKHGFIFRWRGRVLEFSRSNSPLMMLVHSDDGFKASINLVEYGLSDIKTSKWFVDEINECIKFAEMIEG